jgi:hypothetical protein
MTMHDTDDDPVLGAAAADLARLTVPTFAYTDPADVKAAFAPAFGADPFGPDPAFVDRLAQLVAQHSGGRVTVHEASAVERDRMGPLVKGAAGYLVVDGPDGRLDVVLVPTFPPLVHPGDPV